LHRVHHYREVVCISLHVSSPNLLNRFWWMLVLGERWGLDQVLLEKFHFGLYHEAKIYFISLSKTSYRTFPYDKMYISLRHTTYILNIFWYNEYLTNYREK
jgi:hypothetical protein